MTKRGLVLAGGGLAGIAWETGILRGIADEAPDGGARTARRRRPARHVGRVDGGRAARQRHRPRRAVRRQVAADVARDSTPGSTSTTSPSCSSTAMTTPDAHDGEKLQRIGAIALATDTVAEPVRRAVIAHRLPVARLARPGAAGHGHRHRDRRAGDLRPRLRHRPRRRRRRELRGARGVAAGDDRRPPLHGRRRRQHRQHGRGGGLRRGRRAGAVERVRAVAVRRRARSPRSPPSPARRSPSSPTTTSLAAFGPNPLDPGVPDPVGERRSRAGPARGRRGRAVPRRVRSGPRTRVSSAAAASSWPISMTSSARWNSRLRARRCGAPRSAGRADRPRGCGASAPTARCRWCGSSPRNRRASAPTVSVWSSWSSASHAVVGEPAEHRLARPGCRAACGRSSCRAAPLCCATFG